MGVEEKRLRRCGWLFQIIFCDVRGIFRVCQIIYRGLQMMRRLFLIIFRVCLIGRHAFQMIFRGLLIIYRVCQINFRERQIICRVCRGI